VRRVDARFGHTVGAEVRRIVDFEDFEQERKASVRLAVLTSNELQRASISNHAAAEPGIDWIEGELLRPGDVIVCKRESREAIVLCREADRHHSLLLTNRCNSYCLMCSQPPTPDEDSWRVDEALDVIRHLRASPATLGLTGGEPALLGHELRRVIDAVAELHPSTRVEVLTNARLLGTSAAREWLSSAPATTWLVPIYGHADFLHDFVVQTPGAFDQTLSGLLALQEHKQQIQLRTVLIEPVLEILPELCYFIGRNLPFVNEVALMACEPIGFALANRDKCMVDLIEWQETLIDATAILRRFEVPFLLMNAPHCATPKQLWPSAHKSISDWKNVYAPECDSCAMRADCCGLFAWHEKGWKPTSIKPIASEKLI
jgi:His-Xaa-Ser system radical SAM maturase HxsC